MDAKQVAEDSYRGMKRGKTLVISGFHNWLVAQWFGVPRLRIW